MSLDRSLKTAGSLAQHRSVLTRAERIAKLKVTHGFDAAKKKILGLPKTNSRKIAGS